MNRLLTLLFCLQFLGLNAQESTFIHGKIINHSANVISVQYLYDNFTSYKASINVDINDAGEFKAEVLIAAPTIIRLFYQQKELDIYLEPGKNNAINAIHDEYVANWKNLIQENTALSDGFISYMTLHHQYTWLDALARYVNADSLKIDNQKAFETYFTDEIINNPSALKHPQYDHFLYYSVFTYCEEMLGQELDYYEDAIAIYTCLKESDKLSPEIKNYAIGKLLYFNIKPTTVEAFETYYQDFIRTTTSDDVVQKVKKRYAAAQSFTEGKTAPEFELNGKNNTKIKLSDLRGKKVYLSFWASWCGPCKYEIINAKDNRAVLGDEVFFIYVSLDNDKSKWEKHAVTNEQSGVHLWGQGMNSEIARNYGIKTLPHNFLIDESGNFIVDYPKSDTDEFVDFIRSVK